MATIAPLIVILGPTASGKTAAGVELAKQIGGEIICADSRTIYREMNIGTAKPAKEEQQGVAHHLLGIINPDEKYSAAQFQTDAKQLIDEIWARGKYPIMVGGTGLYIDSVLFNYQFSDVSGQRDTENPRHLVDADTSDREGKIRNNTLVLGISVERPVLKERIEVRVERMFAGGFLGEVEALQKKYGWENESMSGIGYRLAREYFEGRASNQEVKEAFVRRDMSLAKRQMTWFKRNPEIEWFEDANKLVQRGADFARQYPV